MRYYIRRRRAATRVPKEAHLAAGTGYCLTGLSGFGARFPVARLQQQPPNAPSTATTVHYPAVEVTGSPGSVPHDSTHLQYLAFQGYSCQNSGIKYFTM
ncbi:hypothetical protein ACI65C_008015 [Semiaphis heraclei]